MSEALEDTKEAAPEHAPDEVEVQVEAEGDKIMHHDSEKPVVDTPGGDPEDIPKEEVEMTKQCCNCDGFCTYPMGGKAATIVVLSLLSVLLTLAGIGSCNFFRVGTENSTGTMKWGLLWREETQMEEDATSRITHCIRWSPTEQDMLFDSLWQTGRAFAYLTIITVIVAFGVVLSLSCATISKLYAILLGVCFIMASIFQALGFLALASELCTSNDCTLSFGAGVSVGGIVLCLLTAIALFLLHPLSPKMKQHDQEPQDAVTGQEEHDNESKTHHEDEEEEEHRQRKEEQDEKDMVGEGDPETAVDTDELHETFAEVPLGKEEKKAFEDVNVDM